MAVEGDQGDDLVYHLLSRLPLCVLLAAARPALPHLADAAHDGEVPLVGLAAHRPQVVCGHGVAVLHTQLLQTSYRVARCLRPGGVVGHGGQRGLAVLGRHTTVQLVQHSPGSRVL